jgi:sulfate-transporting ATPase
VYLLAGQGLVLVYRGSGIINFAQGAMGMAGAFTFYELRQARGVPTPLALVLACLGSASLGAALHFGMARPLRRAPTVARLLGPLAVLIFLLAIADVRYGADFVRLDPLLPNSTVHVLDDLSLGADRLIVFAVGVVLTAALAAGFRWTRVGLATSAVAENRRAAASLGISPDVVAVLNWGMAAVLATVAAVLTSALSGTLNVSALVLLVVPGLAAALVGGFRSFLGTALGATLIGVAESEMARYVSTPGWAKSVPFLVIIAVLILRGRPLPLRGDIVQRATALGTGRVRPLAISIASAAALLAIWRSEPSWVDAISTTCVVALIVLSVVVVTGLAGQLSLAQYALAGMGAWIAARLVANYGLPFPLALALGVAGAIPIGVLVGLPAVRARGVNLAIATLGLALVLEQLILANPERTGGSYGTNVGTPSLFGIELDNVRHPERYATVVLLLLLGACLAVVNLRRGRGGRRLLAVRANERAAAALGISLPGAKLYAFGLSSAIAALGGIMMAFRNPIVVFRPFNVVNSIYIAMFAVIGGIGSAVGAIIGALLSPGTVTQRLLATLFGDDEGTVQTLKIIGGAGALAALLAYPNGLAAFYADRWRRLTMRRKANPAGQPEAAARAEVTQVPTATLEVRELRVRFGGVAALEDASIVVRPGEVVGLIGPNGAGKTTLIDAVTGFVEVSRGVVSLGGTPIQRLPASRRARLGVSRSFQSLELFDSMTVRENIQVASDPRDSIAYLTDLVHPTRPPLPPWAAAAIEEFELGPDLDRLPSELPLGRRRLVAIARAIAAGPSVLLLDEPAAGLSRIESDELGALVRRLADKWGIAVLMVEHDVGLVMDVCDRVAVLDQGRLIAEGTPDEVRRIEAVADAYLGKHVDAGTVGPPDACWRQPQIEARPAVVANGSGPKPAGPLIEAVGLSAGHGALVAVRDLDLAVRGGEIVALLGPNGAGKSTTLLTLAGELAPIAGEVRWRGAATAAPLQRRARDGLGFITEERSVFMQLSVAANLRLGRGSPEVAKQLFPELGPLAGRRAGLLSGGEQQILTLARALAGEPALLLADELSLGLAPLVVGRLFDALRDAADKGVGVLLVEQHARRALEVADRVYVLNRGRVVLEGAASELRERESEVQASYLASV